MLGAADAELLFDAVDAVAAEDPKAVLLGVEKMARSGRDPSQFARDLLAHLRHLLVTQTTGEVPTSFVVTATDAARMQAQASAVGAATLVRTIDELADALTAVREGDDARMAVEIALLKAARPDLDPSTEGLLRRIERLERQLAGAGRADAERPRRPSAPVAPPAPQPPNAARRTQPRRQPKRRGAPEPAPPEPRSRRLQPRRSAATDPADSCESARPRRDLADLAGGPRQAGGDGAGAGRDLRGGAAGGVRARRA